MKSFSITHASSIEQACGRLAKAGGNASVMAGGQDLLGLMKDYIVTPDEVIDLKRILGLDAIRYDRAKGLTIGALATLTDVERHPAVRAAFPAVAEAAGSVGSVQIRNAGTLGGNLCQRPRCWYYRNEHIICLKKGGDRCHAAEGDAQNKYHAIFGSGPCHIVHPSDMAPALVCLGAKVNIAGPGHSRSIPIAEFYVLPENGGVYEETSLQPGEIVTSVHIPASPLASRSIYLKCRERESFDFALASVAMAVRTEGDTIVEASIVLGGVAPAPWRAKSAEEAVRGKQMSSDATLDAIAAAAVDGAKPLSQNSYKVALVQAVVRKAFEALRLGPRAAYAPEDVQWLV